MNKYPYTAMLLIGFPRLAGIIERLEWTVYNRALATHGFCGAFPMSTLEQVSEIIKMIDKKTLLIDLKKAVARSLNKLEKIDRVILVRHFVKGYAPSKVVKSLGFGKSGYYYRLNGALDRFGTQLAERGFDKNWFYVNCCSNAWFRKLFKFSDDGEKTEKAA